MGVLPALLEAREKQLESMVHVLEIIRITIPIIELDPEFGKSS
jgi:hypothetical protein